MSSSLTEGGLSDGSNESLGISTEDMVCQCICEFNLLQSDYEIEASVLIRRDHRWRTPHPQHVPVAFDTKRRIDRSGVIVIDRPATFEDVCVSENGG